MDFGRRQTLDVLRLTLLDARDRRVRVDAGEFPAGGQGDTVIGESAFAACNAREAVPLGERLQERP